MKPDRCHASLLNIPSIPEVKTLVEERLTHDWIVRVEHSNEVQRAGTGWQQWGDASFAITDASPVIDNIIACRTNYPAHNIRLLAEKIQPRTRFLYPVYRAHELEPEAASLLKDSVPLMPHVNELLQSLGDRVRTTRTTAWRVVTVIGMLIASLIAIEEVMIS